LRSKGFCWFAPSQWNSGSANAADPWRHDTAMYWSHAGKHFSITAAGKWWDTISREQMKQYLSEQELERILRDDFVSEEFGDRRQEIVFIGLGLDEEKIRSALDACLLTEKEMGIYRQMLRNYMDTIQTTRASSLFDVGTVDHLDAAS
jgi:G3E family GTPase